MNYYFDTEVACEYGVNEAILLKNFQFWILKNKANERHFYDGHYWLYNSQKAMTKLFPFWSEDQIYRIIKKLKEAGVLLTGNYNDHLTDHTQWYSFIDEDKWLPELSQNRGIDAAKSRERLHENEKSSNCTDSKPDNKPDKGACVNPTQKHEENIKCIREAMNQLYQRHLNSIWNYDEEVLLVGIAARPDCIQELKEILDFKERAGWFPESVLGMLKGWNTTLDRSRIKVNSKRQPTLHELEIQRVSFERQMKNHPGNQSHPAYDRSNTKAREEYKEIKANHDKLEQMIRAHAKANLIPYNGPTAPTQPRI